MLWNAGENGFARLKAGHDSRTTSDRRPSSRSLRGPAVGTPARWALGWAPGKTVLDVACGTGYGGGMLAGACARLVVAVDLAGDAIRYASGRYPATGNLKYVQADARARPFAAGQFDLVVSFETIEHVADPERLARELARVIAPDGLCAISTPNPVFGSQANEFHAHELPLGEFGELLSRHFAHVDICYQVNWVSSAVLSLDDARGDRTRRARTNRTPLPAKTAFVPRPAAAYCA
jgi:2-polyprenyl-3-methyl-5-hydroxy-6-metoxy-1,4-benzoquinol methylase